MKNYNGNSLISTEEEETQKFLFLFIGTDVVHLPPNPFLKKKKKKNVSLKKSVSSKLFFLDE